MDPVRGIKKVVDYRSLMLHSQLDNSTESTGNLIIVIQLVAYTYMIGSSYLYAMHEYMNIVLYHVHL